VFSFNLVQWGALGAGLAGGAWILAGIISLVTIGQTLCLLLAHVHLDH
jgi:hypothetical protein